MPLVKAPHARPAAPRLAGAPCSGRALSLLLLWCPSLPLRTASGWGQVTGDRAGPERDPGAWAVGAWLPTSLPAAGPVCAAAGRAAGPGPSLWAGAFLLQESSHLWLPQPPVLVSVFAVMLHCPLEAFPQCRTHTAPFFPLRKASEGRQLHGGNWQGECGQRVRASSQPAVLQTETRERGATVPPGDRHRVGHQETLASRADCGHWTSQ